MKFNRIKPGGQLDWLLWALGAAVLLSLVGFGVYYYYDRYVHPDQSVMDRQAEHVEELVKKNPQNADLRVTVAGFYLDNNLADQAVAQCQEALKIQPDHQGALIMLGNAYKAKGDFANALKNYNRVLELNKDNPMAKIDTRLEEIYYNLGAIYDEQGKPNDAISALKQALAIDKTDSDAHFSLGRIYQKRNDQANAVQEFEQALRYDPTYIEPYRALTTSYAAIGKKPEAQYAQAMVVILEGKYQDGANQLEALIKQYPDLSRAYFGLGVAYEKLNRLDQAQQALQKFVAAYPNDLAGQDALARVTKGGK